MTAEIKMYKKDSLIILKLDYFRETIASLFIALSYPLSFDLLQHLIHGFKYISLCNLLSYELYCENKTSAFYNGEK